MRNCCEVCNGEMIEIIHKIETSCERINLFQCKKCKRLETEEFMKL